MEQRWDLRVLSPEQRFVKKGRGNWVRGAGFLVQSIKKPQSIELPKGFEGSAQIQLRRDAESNRERIQRKRSTQRERVAGAQVQSRFRAFNVFWKSLSVIEQADFVNSALDRADATKRHGYYGNQGREDPLFEQYRQVILRDHFERSLP